MMRKIIFISGLVLMSLSTYAQQANVVAKRVMAIDSLYLNGVWVTKVDADSTLGDGSDNVVPTQGAVKKYRNIDTVSTISQLENYHGSAYILVVTDSVRGGIFTKSDNNLTADSGVVFNAGGDSYFVRKYDSQKGIDPEWFPHIVGNGLFDCSVGFSVLFNKVEDGTKICFAPNRKFYISTPIFINKRLHIDLSGDTILNDTKQVASFSVQKQYSEVENGFFSGVFVAFNNTSGSFSAITNCIFINPIYYPIGISGSTTPISNISVVRCNFFGQAHGPDGISNYGGIQVTGSASSIYITGCYFQNVTSGITADGAVAGELVSDIHIENCTIDSVQYYGVKFEAGNNLYVNNSNFNECLYGIALSSKDGSNQLVTGNSGKGFFISNNLFRKNTNCIYWLTTNDGYSEATIIGNTMDSCDYGMRRSGGGKISLLNNTFKDGYSFVNAYDVVGGNLLISNNYIENTLNDTTNGVDFEGDTIRAAIIISTGATNGHDSVNQNIRIINNTIKWWYDNAIQIDRKFSQSPDCSVENNLFIPGNSSNYSLSISASSHLKITGNKSTGENDINIPNPSRIQNDRNIICDNSWQIVPTSATSPGIPGEKIIASDGIYICTETNAWVKVAYQTSW